MSRRRENGSLEINIVDKDLPRASNGDIKFESFEELELHFTEEEITTLCERALYHMEYQRNHHKKYTQRIRDLEAPVKETAKRLFPGIAYIRLTPEQHAEAIKEAYREEEE
jgi:hypothetical protein